LENPFSMKQLIRNITNQELVTFAIIAILSLIVWFAGPYLVIANHLPLFEAEKRFGIIMVFFLGWLLLSLIFSTTAPQKTAKPTSTPETLKKLQQLQGRFQGAIEFLQKTIINRQGHNINLSNLPWYLVLGPQNSGKTSLLANANVNFILSKQFKPESLKSIPPSESCDWWITRDLVLVDIPSGYIQCRDKTNKNTPRGSLQNILWYNLLNLIHDHRKERPLNGIVITLNLPEMIRQQNNTQQKTIIPDLKQRIVELKEKFGASLPCYIIMTKCDLLPGFVEFFGESASEELSQPWGITLPALHPSDKLSDVVMHRFNALIKRLNKQLIWRLHQERNPQARTMVKDFPLQMERVKEATVQFIKALGISNLHLHAIYLSSALQTNTEETAATAAITINQSNHQALQILQTPHFPSKPYFVRQMIMQGLLHTQEYISPLSPPLSWQHRGVYAASIGAISAAVIFLGYDFQRGLQQTNLIQSNLTQYQQYMQQAKQEGHHLLKALPLLNSLQDVSTHSKHNANRLAIYSHKSQHAADEVYAKALQTIVLPEVKTDLEKYLKSVGEKNPAQLYAALKAYVMLGDAQHLEADFIINTIIKQLLFTKTDSQTAEQLSSHLNAALSTKFISLQLDDKLIAQARKQLTNLSSAELAYIILKNTANNNSDSAIKLGTDSDNSPVFVSKALTNQIPNMFTAEQFKAILAGEINTAVTEATQGNWILGDISSNQNPTALVEQLHTQYIANYIDIWESQLANIKLYLPKNLIELNTTLATLTSNNSPLLQMLQTIQQNTTFDAITSASPKLQNLNALLANASNNQNNTLYQMFLSFQELHNDIQTIVNSGDLGNAAFQVAKKHLQKSSPDAIARMNTLAQQLPDPMKSWLISMSTQSWNLISRAAAHQIDDIWQKDIISTYHAQIAGRFPFAREASQEVSLQAFTTFIGQQGMLTQFYQVYLKPFVDDSQAEWRWKNIEGQQLPLKNEILNQLQSISKIQRAFFPNGDNQLYVQFTLQPMSLEATMKSFNLTINGQQINYQKNDPSVPRVVSWPGNNNTVHATSINFISPSNKLFTSTIQGDWGWFRLVEQTTQNINSRKELVLQFDIDGHMAKYLLFTQGHLNPFLPLNFEKIQLPDALT
jgi:type VI secretion system protein ImpL